MDRIWNFIIDGIIAIVIMFVSVTVYFGLREETVVKSMVSLAVDDFMTDVRRNGYITTDDYEALYDKLSVTKEFYDITLEHTYKIREPEYRRRTLQEILDAQNTAYTGSNIYTYSEVITQKPVVTDPVNISNLNTENNESVLASAVNTPAPTDHVHTEDCYAGHRHTDGVGVVTSTYQHGCYVNVTSGSSTSCGGTFHLVNSESYSGTYVCLHCHDSYSYSGTLNQYQCSNCHSTAYIGTTDSGSWTCKCGSTSYAWSSNRGTITDGSSCNNSTSTIIYKCNEEEDSIPECSRVVTAIAPTHPNQTLYIGDNIISTAVATYLDGSTRTIICDVSGYDKNKLGTQTVTLIYSGLVDSAKITGTKICTIKVNVIPKNKSCKKGHTYNLNSEGKDPGCPYCKAWVENLQLSYPVNPSIVITIGTTLQDNGVKLLATYMDGHTEMLTNEYSDNLDTKYLGMSIVTIGYKGITIQIKVTTVCVKMICSICGNSYNLYPDKSDPGCPHCLAKIPVFTGNILNYDENMYTEDILKSLYKNQKYKLNQNDLFTITLENKSSNIARKILKRIIPSISEQWIHIKKSSNVSSN